MSESMMMVVEKLKNLRESIINKEITDENVIKDKLTKIRLIAEENGVAFIIDDEEYIRYLKNPSIGEESEEEEESSSEEEYYDWFNIIWIIENLNKE